MSFQKGGRNVEIPNIQNGQPFASSTAIGTSTGTAPNTASSVRDSLSSPKEVNSDANRIDELAKSSSSQSNKFISFLQVFYCFVSICELC